MRLGQDMEERLINDIEELKGKIEFIKTEKPRMALATVLTAISSVLSLLAAALLFGFGYGGGGCFGIGVAICSIFSSFFCGITWDSMNSTEAAYKNMVLKKQRRIKAILNLREKYEP